MKKLVVIDGKSVFYRGYYAMSSLSRADGTPTGGVYGFIVLAFEVIKRIKPDYVIVAWDKKGTSTARRTEIYPEYKAGRKKPPEDFFAQIPLLIELLDAMGWPFIECDGYEADDIMGTLSEQANAQGINTYLISGDMDMLQLIDHDTEVYVMKRGFSKIDKFSLESFEEKYGLKQSQFLDLKALQGDSSDNIPGVSGIGAKTATKLLQEYGTLDNIYANLENIRPTWSKKLSDNKDVAYMSRELAKIWCDAPVELDLEAAATGNFNYQKFIEKLRELEFTSLINKIPEEMHKLDSHEDQVELFNPGLFNLISSKLKIVAPKDFFSEDQSEIFIDVDEANKKITIANYQRACEFESEKIQDFWPKILNIKSVFYNAKNAFHALDKRNLNTDFKEIYDVEQMAFLLNPLIRDKSLSAILEKEIDETIAVQRILAISEIYENQREALKNLPQTLEVAKKLDFPLIKVLHRMEKLGVKIDPDFFAKTSQKFEEEITKIEEAVYEMADMKFNIGSPQQLSKVLFENLELPTKGIKKSKTGYSTGQKELNKLRGLHPIIEYIEKYREHSKLKNTYIDTLPKLADSNSRVHTTFNQDVTSTGRLSSTNPNLQNIPIRTELGRAIREGFVAEPNKVLISADYSQFELRLAAILSGDEPFITAFNEDADIHTRTAAEIFEVPENEVKKSQRRAAKTINFSVLYGAGAHNLSQQTGVSVNEAREYIDSYFKTHKAIRDFLDQTLERAQEIGYVETFYGRRRPTPDINSKNFIVREAARRAAANMPIQGTEADLMKRAMLKVDEKIVRTGLGEQILQIHDSIMIEAPKDKADEIAQILQREMENVAPELDIKLKVDVSIGENWLEL
ncbi:MAG: DNA polymerase I [Candidatus Sacchiramonaceae bacterium]|nr:DNA polymerase I [Candidatus Saccharimonadaceae bacterium]